MGGNALKNCETRRLPAEEYHSLCRKVELDIQRLYPTGMIRVIPAYRQKESFGDMDILVEKGIYTPHLFDSLRELWGSKEEVHNNDCHSMELNGFQIDIIAIHQDLFSFALAYYSWNDLGNLMGRVAHKMGLKFGHDGLYSVLRDGTHHLDEILLTCDPLKAMSWLGFDVPTFLKGFDTLEDIFEFVAKNERFNPDIYLFDNMNAISRIRDKKRKTYTTFLAWCEEYKRKNPDREYFKYPPKTTWLAKIRIDFPGFSQMATQSHQFIAWRQYLAKKFNGEIVQAAVGLEGKELGKFMKEFIEYRGGKDSKTFQEWIMDSTPEQKEYDLRHFFQIFSTFNLSLV